MPVGNGAEGKRLEETRRQLGRWRRRRGRGGGRMPSELWRLAAEAAAECGVEATAVRLRLDPDRLRHWMERLGLKEGAAERPQFVELPPLTPLMAACPPECTLELEEPSGRKLRISLKGPATAQALQLGQLLWGNQP